MSDDEEVRWCDCDRAYECYGGSNFLGVKCKIKSTKNGRVPFLRPADEDQDEEH